MTAGKIAPPQWKGTVTSADDEFSPASGAEHQETLPPATRELIATAALLCCDRGVDPVVAIQEASKIRGVIVESPETFLCEYAHELTEAVNTLLQAKWETLKRTAKLRTAAALQSLFKTGALERAFIELVDGLSSDDPLVRERAAKQIRDIALKLTSEKDPATSAGINGQHSASSGARRTGPGASSQSITDDTIRQKVKFFISEEEP